MRCRILPLTAVKAFHSQTEQDIAYLVTLPPRQQLSHGEGETRRVLRHVVQVDLRVSSSRQPHVRPHAANHVEEAQTEQPHAQQAHVLVRLVLHLLLQRELLLGRQAEHALQRLARLEGHVAHHRAHVVVHGVQVALAHGEHAAEVPACTAESGVDADAVLEVPGDVAQQLGT